MAFILLIFPILLEATCAWKPQRSKKCNCEQDRGWGMLDSNGFPKGARMCLALSGTEIVLIYMLCKCISMARFTPYDPSSTPGVLYWPAVDGGHALFQSIQWQRHCCQLGLQRIFMKQVRGWMCRCSFLLGRIYTRKAESHSNMFGKSC